MEGNTVIWSYLEPKLLMGYILSTHVHAIEDARVFFLGLGMRILKVYTYGRGSFQFGLYAMTLVYQIFHPYSNFRGMTMNLMNAIYTGFFDSGGKQ